MASPTNSRNGSSRNRRFSPNSKCSNVSTSSLLLISALIALLLIAFGSLHYYLPYCPHLKSSYNFTNIAQIKALPDGSTEYHIAIISDMDHDSKVPDKSNLWQSLLYNGTIVVDGNRQSARVSWGPKTQSLKSQISAGGRAMELSDLVLYDGNVLSVDDRTGFLYKIVGWNDVIPWVFLNDGPGNTTKGFKGEWMTVKDDLLYVGGLGKEWTTPQGVFVNYNPMFVKVVNSLGEVVHLDWVENYKKLRRAIGVEYPGYMIFESGQWSSVHRKWFFLPRRASKEMYSEDTDEFQGTNVLLIADENFYVVESKVVGNRGDGSHGFSAFQFLPNSDDSIIVALKSQEKDGAAVASYITVFNVETGHILLDESKVPGGKYKFEGLLFI